MLRLVRTGSTLARAANNHAFRAVHSGTRVVDDPSILVKCELKDSALGGTGLYAGEDISKGTLIWSFPKSSLIEYDDEDAQALIEDLKKNDPEGLKSLLTGCFFGRKFSDNRTCPGRYFNHSHEDPNTVTGFNFASVGLEMACPEGETYSTFAARDISEGEELLIDYDGLGVEEPQWFRDVLIEHGFDDGEFREGWK